jgi:hypothetical protein
MNNHKVTVKLSSSMSEPAYILHNGQSMPYIPKEITDHRTAYAATLHVLFKHVADFHICIVKVFSKKYGIPEDDIMQTIQESDEFKNMAVDPVLDPSDALGYLRHEDAHPQTETETTTATATTTTTVPITTTVHVPEMKKIVKKKQPAKHVVVEPVVVEPVVVEPVVVEPVVVEPVKKKIIRKKVAPEKPEMQEQTVIAVESVVVEPVAVEPVKKKIIRKKVAPEKQEQEAQSRQERNERNDLNERNERNDHVPDLLLIDHATTTKKIIRKKK